MYLFQSLVFAIGIPTFIYLYSKTRQSFLIAFYFIGSHLLLDTFGLGVGFFYPFCDSLIFTCMPLSLATWDLSHNAVGMMQALTEATKDQVAPAVTPFGEILIVLIFAGMVMRKTIKGQE